MNENAESVLNGNQHWFKLVRGGPAAPKGALSPKDAVIALDRGVDTITVSKLGREYLTNDAA